MTDVMRKAGLLTGKNVITKQYCKFLLFSINYILNYILKPPTGSTGVAIDQMLFFLHFTCMDMCTPESRYHFVMELVMICLTKLSTDCSSMSIVWCLLLVSFRTLLASLRAVVFWVTVTCTSVIWAQRYQDMSRINDQGAII